VKQLSLNLPSPIEALPEFSNTCNVYVKREELIHSDFGGNKWRKLKYNIEHYFKAGYRTIITFGGPFSNHIAASAAVCAAYDIPVAGIIRGTYKDQDNPTLIGAENKGMHLHHVPKADYKLKTKSILIQGIIKSYENPLVIPEGGSNADGLDGMQDLVVEIDNYPVVFDVIGVAAGTGTTSAGIIKYIQGKSAIKVINVLKNESLHSEIESKIYGGSRNWEVIGDYHFGGYAKTTKELRTFAQGFYNDYKIPLDPIYNSKLFYAMQDMMDKKLFKQGANILIINTGGYQGIDAYNYVNEQAWIKC